MRDQKGIHASTWF